MSILILFLFVSVGFFSCQKESNSNYSSSDIEGTWIRPVYNNDTITFERSNMLPNEDYGISFIANNKLIERKNAGWCGTPPITYANYNGTWVKQDSFLTISSEYWGGFQEYKWKVLLLDNQQLKVKVIE